MFIKVDCGSSVTTANTFTTINLNFFIALASMGQVVFGEGKNFSGVILMVMVEGLEMNAKPIHRKKTG